MIAVDTNILVYAHRRESRHHPKAATLLRRLAEGPDIWAIPWPCVYEFFSVVTNPRIWKSEATSPSGAWAQIAAWVGSPTLRLLSETPDFLQILSRVLGQPRVRGPIVHDASVAALCLAHGVELLWTRDRDFALIPDLATVDPLAG
jgi:toxin-antitoxin system PIN domain toxin